MAKLNETAIINKLAGHIRLIPGITRVYDFAEMPNSLAAAVLPAFVFLVSEFSSNLPINHNKWRNELTVTGILFGENRTLRGGKLKYLDNAILPFGQKVRTVFLSNVVIRDLMEAGATQAFLRSGEYSAEHPLLSFNREQYIGWVFKWVMTEVN